MHKLYYFDVVGERATCPDNMGTRLIGPEAAKLQATIIAAELAHAGSFYRGCEVCVVDDEGHEIARRPILMNPDA